MSSLAFSKQKSVSKVLILFLLLSCHKFSAGFVAPMLSLAARRFTVRSSSVLSTMIPSNEELVEQRLEVARAKKEARIRSIQDSRERNLALKRVFHNDTRGNHQVPNMYAIKVSVGQEMRDELKLNGREKRGRVFVEVNSDATKSLRGLRFELHSFFRALKKRTYLLEASLPEIDKDGNILSSNEIWENLDSWKVETDEDVAKTFSAAEKFFADNDEKLKRPSLLLHVTKDPNAPEPPPPPRYLDNMADPTETESMTMLSFYAFPPSTIENPDEFALLLRSKWVPFNTLGRVYVAREGVNAQMSVPTNVLDNFMECCRSIPELGQWVENGINVDPKPIPIQDFATAGVPINGRPAPPFRNLHIRVRNQVVADGLKKPLNWQSAGYDMPPLEWHEKLKEAREKYQAGLAAAPVLLDCRNSYETDVGKFELAQPLNTENFRESWDVIKERLADKPKDTPIMMYCTGGIRCVKTGAYVTQELGFTNVSRLAGGIIAYDRTLQELKPGEESMFKGANFVFDGRLGRPITEDDFGVCITCGAETSLVSNCLNDSCHKRMVQCEKCRTTFHGSCSDACRQRVLNGAMVPKRDKIGSHDTDLVQFTNLEDYSSGYSSPAPSFFREIELNTKQFMSAGAHMVSGDAQGRWLKQLTSISREGRVLELGTFTGYATACFLEGAANAGSSIDFSGVGNRDGGPYVMTMERDARAINVATAHLKIMAQYGLSEQGAEAACALRGGKEDIPVVHDDVVSLTYSDMVGCDIVRVTDALATVEAMASDSGDLIPAPFDIVFVDADKTRLLEYVEALVSNDRVLKKGGLIIVDNVLWKGLVLESSQGESPSFTADDESIDTDDEDGAARKGRRARKLANKMHRFNSEVVKDDRVEVVVLPMRDGLSIIRKR